MTCIRVLTRIYLLLGDFHVPVLTCLHEASMKIYVFTVYQCNPVDTRYYDTKRKVFVKLERSNKWKSRSLKASNKFGLQQFIDLCKFFGDWVRLIVKVYELLTRVRCIINQISYGSSVIYFIFRL